MKKRFTLVIAALLLGGFCMNAQPGGFGGPGMGGPGMGPGGDYAGASSFDPFADIRPEYAARKTRQLTKALLLDEKQAKKVEKVYRHPDTDLSSEMPQQRPEGRPERPEGMPQGGPGGFGGPGMGGPGGGFRGPGMGPKRDSNMDIPVSESERAWREKKMKKILTEAQYEKWLSIEDRQALPAPELK